MTYNEFIEIAAHYESIIKATKADILPIRSNSFVEFCDLINRQNAEIERLNSLSIKIQDNYFGISNLANKLRNKIKTAKSEAIIDFSKRIDEVFLRYAHLHSHADCARKDYIKLDDGTEIEMQSVWDVFALKRYEMCEYEEMGRLQKNIETIANERLLAELEKDFRLLVNEMVGDAEKKDLLIERIKMVIPPSIGYWADVIADELLDDGWTRLPCKVGDVVYAIQEKNIKELTVQYINIHKNDIEIVVFPKNENKFGYSFGSNKLGKTVFLTREEAEQALRKEDEGK